MSAGERKAGYPDSSTGKRQASHGLNHAELEQHRKNQKAGKVEMVKAIPGRKGQSEDDPYMVPKVEYLYHYHLEVEAPLYDQGTGEKLSPGPHVLKLHERAYEQAVKVNQFSGKEVAIIHDPTLAQAKIAGGEAPVIAIETITPLEEMKGKELAAMAIEHGFPKEEWGKLLVPELREYIIDKTQNV